jgi:hypothetical protein
LTSSALAILHQRTDLVGKSEKLVASLETFNVARLLTYWNQGGPNDGKATSLQGQAQNYATAANISYIAGGALAALGVVLYFAGAPDGQAGTPDAHAYLMPALGPGFAGLNTGGTW